MIIRTQAVIFILLLCHMAINTFFKDAQNCYNFGHKILLIINFNHAHYTNIPFLTKLYEPFFPHIVFYGPEEVLDQVRPCPEGRETNGYYAYTGMADAMQRYPDYEGYFWLNDDCAIFIWNLTHLDKKKIWATSIGFPNVAKNIASGIYHLERKDPAPWCWWKLNSKQCKIVYEALPEDNRIIMEKDFGPRNIVCGPAEACYIPRSYAKDFIELSNLCIANKLFIEIAFPMMLACLEYMDKRETLNIEWGLNNKRMRQLTNLKYPWNFTRESFFLHKKIACCHPLKFSNHKNRKFIETLYKISVG